MIMITFSVVLLATSINAQRPLAEVTAQLTEVNRENILKLEISYANWLLSIIGLVETVDKICRHVDTVFG